MGQSSTIYQTGGQTSVFSYKNNIASVVGQIGLYKGIPLIAFHSTSAAQKFSEAMYALNKSYETAAPSGNLYVYSDAPDHLCHIAAEYILPRLGPGKIFQPSVEHL